MSAVSYTRRLIFLSALQIIIVASAAYAELLMDPHGHLTIGPYIHGFQGVEGRYPGYRSEFTTSVDFFSIQGIVVNSLLGTTTIISSRDANELRLDRIRYTLSPNLRWEAGAWAAAGVLHHECIHRISRQEADGSIWWNSLRLMAGTRGAFSQFRAMHKRLKSNRFVDAWDVKIMWGSILPPDRTVFTGQNHDYRNESELKLSWHTYILNEWVIYVTGQHHIWQRLNHRSAYSTYIKVDLLRTDLDSIFGFYYSYYLHDTFTPDNQSEMGALGCQILF